MNFYSFHIGDYLSATRHLTWEEDAAYRRLLDVYYTTEGPLPLDLRACCRLVLASTEDQRIAVQTVLEEFFKETPEGWVNTRADSEIANMKERQQKQKDKANKRWHPPVPEHGNATAMPRHEETDATASKNDASAMPPVPVPIPVPNKELATKRRTQLPEGFTPNEVGRAKAGEKGLSVETELAKFSDYHRAKGSVMLDWQAAWRTWIGNARPAVADVARQTVPSSPGRDPALIKAEEDAKRAAPIPPQLRETIAKLTGRAVA